MNTRTGQHATRSQPFTVDVRFLGIMAVVPDADKPTKLAIVVPATDLPVDAHPKAVDGHALHRHRWFIEYEPGQVVGAAATPAGTLAHWTLSDLAAPFHRVTFHTDGAGAKDRKLVDGGGLGHVSAMADLAPDFARMPAGHLDWPTSSDSPSVAGQIIVDDGLLIEPPKTEMRTWIYPSTLRPKQKPADNKEAVVSHYLDLRLTDVTAFRIAAQAHPDADPLTLDLHGTPERPVKVTICNLCDENPLRWPAEKVLRVDDDFRWYFELLGPSDYATLRTMLAGLPAPVPHPSARQPNSIGQNCLDTRFAPQPFDFTPPNLG